MNFKLIIEDHLHFSGNIKKFNTKDGEHFKEIPKLWEEVMQDQTFQKLLSQSDDLGVVGISFGFNNMDQTFNYMIGIRTENDHPEMDNISFDKQTFLVFETKGALPSSLQNTIKEAHQSIIPNSNYEIANGPELEVYPKGDGSKEDYICYYYAPVKEK